MELEDIVEKAQNKDELSMELVLQLFKPKVIKICREYFLVGADVDDLIQEGMIGLYKAINSFDRKKNNSFTAYAYVLIHRQIQNAIKIFNSKKHTPLNNYLPISTDGNVENLDNEAPKIVLLSKDKGAEQISLDKERNKFIINRIKEILNTEQFMVLIYYLSGYKYEEISKILSINTKKVDNDIQQIKRKLKDINYKE